jgi:hypothetical protein
MSSGEAFHCRGPCSAPRSSTLEGRHPRTFGTRGASLLWNPWNWTQKIWEKSVDLHWRIVLGKTIQCFIIGLVLRERNYNK